MTDQQLSALLRLKRHEQPPAGYFDRLVQDVHRRQRAELLRRPLWKIAFERVQVFFSAHSMGGVSYAGAMAAVLVMGVAAIGLITPGKPRTSPPSTALASTPAPDQLLSLQSPPLPTLDARSFRTTQKGPAAVVSQPRYVIDARPVSYEPSPSFSF